MSVMESQHGVAAYNKGHRCTDCKAAKKTHDRRLRAARHSTREYVEGMEMCVFCCCWFHPKGLARHEDICGA